MKLYKRQVKYTLYKYHKIGLGSDELATTGWIDEDEAAKMGPWVWADKTGLHSGEVILKTTEQFVPVDTNELDKVLYARRV